MRICGEGRGGNNQGVDARVQHIKGNHLSVSVVIGLPRHRDPMPGQDKEEGYPYISMLKYLLSDRGTRKVVEKTGV